MDSSLANAVPWPPGIFPKFPSWVCTSTADETFFLFISSPLLSVWYSCLKAAPAAAKAPPPPPPAKPSGGPPKAPPPPPPPPPKGGMKKAPPPPKKAPGKPKAPPPKPKPAAPKPPPPAPPPAAPKPKPAAPPPPSPPPPAPKPKPAAPPPPAPPPAAPKPKPAAPPPPAPPPAAPKPKPATPPPPSPPPAEPKPSPAPAPAKAAAAAKKRKSVSFAIEENVGAKDLSDNAKSEISEMVTELRRLSPVTGKVRRNGARTAPIAYDQLTLSVFLCVPVRSSVLFEVPNCRTRAGHQHDLRSSEEGETLGDPEGLTQGQAPQEERTEEGQHHRCAGGGETNSEEFGQNWCSKNLFC